MAAAVPEMKKTVQQAVATASAQSQSMDPVKLIAADGSEIVLDRRAAMVSGTIKSMLSGPGNFSEAQQGEVKFPEMSPRVLEKVVQYFYYKVQRGTRTAPDLPRARALSSSHLCPAAVHEPYRPLARVQDRAGVRARAAHGRELP